MELGPIFRALTRNKTRFVLISLEVALTLAIAVNCINMALDMKHQMERPTGIDEDHLISVRSQPFSPDFKEDGYFDNARKADVELLRSLPGVRAAEYTSAIPLSGSGSSSTYKPLGSEMHTVHIGYFRTGTSILETLGVQLIQGRNFVDSDINESESKNVIVTQAYADRLFPDGDALGKQLQGRTPENPHTIVGLVDHMHGAWPMWEFADHVMFTPGKPGDFNWGLRYLVRAEPGQTEALLATIETQLLQLNNGRNVSVESLSEIKADTYGAHSAVIWMLTIVVLLLIFVTSLGIVGITSFSVTERIHHIGTRRALGARKLDILRYFLLEIWIITTLGLVAGIALTYGLNYLLVTYISGVKLDWRLVASGMILLWLITLFSALWPALRGARVSPAVASRTV